MSLHDDPFHIFIDIHTWAYQLPQRPTVISNLHETYTNLCSTYFTRLYRDDHLPLSPSKHPLIWSSDKDASCRVILYKHLEDCQIKQPFQHDVLQTHLFTDKAPAKLYLSRQSGLSWICCRHLTVDTNMYFDRNGW